MRTCPSGTVSSPGSGLPPYSMNSIMSSWARGLISSSSRDPTRDSPPSTEYVTSFKGSPLLGTRDAALRILAARRVIRACQHVSISARQHFSWSACWSMRDARSSIRLRSALRLQTLYSPFSPGTAIDEPVVQPIFASLPELHHLGLDPVASPEGGAWDLPPLVLRLECPDPFFQHAP